VRLTIWVTHSWHRKNYSWQTLRRNQRRRKSSTTSGLTCPTSSTTQKRGTRWYKVFSKPRASTCMQIQPSKSSSCTNGTTSGTKGQSGSFCSQSRSKSLSSRSGPAFFCPTMRWLQRAQKVSWSSLVSLWQPTSSLLSQWVYAVCAKARQISVTKA